MSDNRDDKLDSMLRSRRVEPASPDLAQRIVLKASVLPQIQNVSLWQSVRQLFAEFHLPKPGYVLASALIIGMLVGFSTAPDNSSIKEANSSTAQLYLSGDEDLL
ncbi:MAG: hypothetical protein ACM3TN_26785 [Alphaproteobacteria bacterium]